MLPMAISASITSLFSRPLLCGLALAAALAAVSGQASARGWQGWRDEGSGAAAVQPEAVVALAELPPQGRATYRAILEGGPFRYDKDGVVFGNRERLLPSARRGHYREYTVETPGARDRGARRIVCGGNDGERQRPPATCWYTADHYASFRRIVP